MADDSNTQPIDLDETTEAEETVHEAFEEKKITKEKAGEIDSTEKLQEVAEDIEEEKILSEGPLGLEKGQSAEEAPLVPESISVLPSKPVFVPEVAVETQREQQREVARETKQE